VKRRKMRPGSGMRLERKKRKQQKREAQKRIE
jgi:hypothetical protein